jgi:AraC-like DNA-binding protein
MIVQPQIRRKQPEAHTDRPGDIGADLRRILRVEILKGGCTATRIASLFSMHRRTMNRRLSKRGTAFRQLADEIRFEIACELLANPEFSFGQVAAALNYSELSAFTRAFRRWSGQTPTAWRAAHVGLEALSPV